MTKVTLKHFTALTLPNGQTLRPDVEATVDKWEVLRNHNVVAAWINAGLLLEDGKKSEGGNSSPSKTAKASGGKGLSPEAQAEADRLDRERQEREAAAARVEAERLEAERLANEANDADLTDEEKAEAKELGIKVMWNSKPAGVREKIAEAKAAKGS